MPSRKPTKSRDINYVSKDFDSIKTDLVTYLKKYFPNSIQDFNDSSGGMAIVDLVAYLGDVLNFQIDRTVNESFITRAVERKNIIALAEMYGYKTKSVVPSTAYISLSATFVNSISADTLFTVKSGTRLASQREPANFELMDDANFADVSRRSFVSNNGFDTTYALTGIRVVAGRTKTFDYQVGPIPRSFLSITLPDRSITEIISVVDQTGTEFFEVDNLATDSIFVGDSNVSSNDDDVNYLLKIRKVPNRFVSEKNPDGTTTIRFGAGDSNFEDSEIVPNPDDFVSPPKLRGSVSGFAPVAVDSSNFLKTKSLGNLPKGNSILTVSYRVGGGVDTNVGADVIKTIIDRKIEFNLNTAEELYPDETRSSRDSLRITNPTAAFGGEDSETNMSIKQNAINSINSQNRCVTLSDYKVRAMSMPSSFGKPFRIIARKDPYKLSGIEIMTIARSSEGKLKYCSPILKNNLESYLKPFKGITDSIRISNGNIVNVGVNFSIAVADGYNKQQALVRAIYAINNFFDIRRMDFGYSLSKSELIRNIQNLEEVTSVPFLRIVNLTGDVSGRAYSDYSIDIENITKNGIIYFPSHVIPELKFLNFDIQGSIA